MTEFAKSGKRIKHSNTSLVHGYMVSCKFTILTPFSLTTLLATNIAQALLNQQLKETELVVQHSRFRLSFILVFKKILENISSKENWIENFR